LDSALQIFQFQLSRNSLVPAPRVPTPVIPVSVIPVFIICNSCACRWPLPGALVSYACWRQLLGALASCAYWQTLPGAFLYQTNMKYILYEKLKKLKLGLLALGLVTLGQVNYQINMKYYMKTLG
jgi:hypothetical protein